MVIAFSTARPAGPDDRGVRSAGFLAETAIDPVFAATAQATEEAIVNALVAAETMVGGNGNRVHALPHEQLRDLLRRYGRLAEPE
jgi:L-aminopeptidase/D-esterase-like protein